MPAERVSMRKIREVLRLTHALGMSRGGRRGDGDRQDGGRRVRAPGRCRLSWPIPEEIE